MAILATLAGLPLLRGSDQAEAAMPLYRWDGTSLGSPSRILLYYRDRAAADRLIGQCAAEIERLERILSLYRSDSEIARLNREGRLTAPSQDLLALLSQCQRLAALSEGAFDVTVQPLWDVYAAHFFRSPSPSPDGPERAAIDRALALVDWRGIDIDAGRVRLAKAGMGLTLNGIAQGYVTDRIAEMLRDHGIGRLLADMGRSEIRTLGGHRDGHPWRIGLADPRAPDEIAVVLDLADRSLCTSGGYGTKFEATGRHHHLFDPKTGTSAHHYIAVSVFAASATLADALSTALYVMPPERGASLLANFPGVAALVTLPDGSRRDIPSIRDCPDSRSGLS